jgi:nucleoside-diphosphate-sugar epimerase
MRSRLLSLSSSKLTRFFYVSTAYICGTTTGTIPEDGMPARNGFRNIYEETKHEAERLVRASGLPFTIFRPSILLGNSRTGDCEGETRMVYGYLLGLHQAALHSSQIRSEGGFARYWMARQGRTHSDYADVSCRLEGWPHTTKNILAIDDCVEMISRIVTTEVRHKTFNLVNPDYITVQQVVDTISASLRVRGFTLAGCMTPTELAGPVERRAHRLLGPFHPYTRLSDPTWSTLNTSTATTGYTPDAISKTFRFYTDTFVEQRLIKGGVLGSS